ncbi:MAG: 5-formyltetrahydrofolate cyclo-ligase [Eubacterium sp.]|nr:5-formyltetrahydrofolate cyclo-ligase [Eubacterium sp.]
MKKELRKELKVQRRSMSNKAAANTKISNYLIESSIYKNADTILFYAALEDEINIDECINIALSQGKKAALPVCLDDKGSMKFYYINSLKDIKTGFFGVREPDTDICCEVADFNDSICIVPAIAYDKKGYRLGYGKGYYDRFLENFSFISVGLCYNELIMDVLPIGEYDIPVDYIITQDGILTI